MTRLRRVVSDWCTGTVFAFAVAGLVFPVHIFAVESGSVWQGPGLGWAGRSIRIEVEEMLEDSAAPSRFRLTTDDGRELLFEHEQGGYTWREAGRLDLRRFQPMPDLDQLMAWDVEAEADGTFRAEIPLGHLQPADMPAIPPGGRLSTAGEPRLETRGYFDQETTSFKVLAVLPGSEQVEISISFAELPAEQQSRVLGPWASGEQLDTRVIHIFVPLATILILLGVAFIACVAMLAACYIACNIVCENGVESVDAAICGVGCNCACTSAGPPDPGCNSLNNAVRTLTLEDGAPFLDVPREPFRLSRLEDSADRHHGTGVRYLMEEWALLSYSTSGPEGARVEVVSASSEGFARARRGDFATNLTTRRDAPAGTHRALVVEVPRHDENSRSIDLPRLRVADAGGGPASDGRVLVRADFAAQGGAPQVTLIDGRGPLPPGLAARLQQSLALDFSSPERHRVVAFAVIDVGDSLALRDSFVFLPRCCCGGHYCF